MTRFDAPSREEPRPKVTVWTATASWRSYDPTGECWRTEAAILTAASQPELAVCERSLVERHGHHQDFEMLVEIHEPGKPGRRVPTGLVVTPADERVARLDAMRAAMKGHQ